MDRRLLARQNASSKLNCAHNCNTFSWLGCGLFSLFIRTALGLLFSFFLGACELSISTEAVQVILSPYEMCLRRKSAGR